VVVVAPMVQVQRAEAAAYLTGRMVRRVHVDVRRTRSDRLNHLSETRRSGVNALSAAYRGRSRACNRKRDDVGGSECTGNGRGIGLRASLRTLSRGRGQIGAQEQDDPARKPGPAEVNVGLQHIRRQIPIGQLVVDGRAIAVNLRLEVAASR